MNTRTWAADDVPYRQGSDISISIMDGADPEQEGDNAVLSFTTERTDTVQSGDSGTKCGSPAVDGKNEEMAAQPLSSFSHQWKHDTASG